jgi:hypothetical protein
VPGVPARLSRIAPTYEGLAADRRPPAHVFKRALELGNLLVAEATAKEIGQVSLAEALELTALIAQGSTPVIRGLLPPAAGSAGP